MKAASAALLLSLSGLLAGCGHAAPNGDSCSNANAFERIASEAEHAATTAYAPPTIEPCPDLDAPQDALASSPGLTATEYASLLRGSDGNFFDDGTWWLKATPRGESHVEPLDIVAEQCDHVSFAGFGYDYASATPPLDSAPECGRYLVGMQAGHRIDASWPQLLSVEGSGLVRLAPLRSATVFGSYLRLPSGLPGASRWQSSLDESDVVGHDDATLELVARSEESSFTAALRLILTPGDATRLSVELELFPRSAGTPLSELSFGALSGTFQIGANDFDFDQMTATFSDGTSSTTALSDPKLVWGSGSWNRISVAKGGASLSAFALTQGSRTSPDNAADGGDAGASSSDGGDAGASSERPDLTLSDIHSDVPLALALSLSSGTELAGNVAASLVLDPSDTSAPNGPIHVSYVVTASLP